MKFWIIKCTAGWLKTRNKKPSYKVVVHQLETDEEQWELVWVVAAGSSVYQ